MMWMPVAQPTRLDELRRRYIRGALTLEAYEAAVAELLASGHEHDPEPHPADPGR